MAFVHETRDEATHEFRNSIAEYHASFEPILTALVREMLDARMTVEEIIRIVLNESEKGTW